MLMFRALFMTLIIYFLSLVMSSEDCAIVYQSDIVTSMPSTLRIMQYNVEWLFMNNSVYDCPGDLCSWGTEEDSYVHMGYVADVIAKLNPDILNLCEVEGCSEISMLLSELEDRGVSGLFGFLKQGTDSSTGQNVAMLTKYLPASDLYRSNMHVNWPLANSRCGYSGPGGSTGVSKHYYTFFNLSNDTSVVMIGTHLLSIPTDPERCAKREAQAQILQELIADFIVYDGVSVILIGDLNDYDGDVLDWQGNIPTSSVLDILKGYSGDRAGEYVLGNAAERISEEDRYTNWWDSDNNCSTNSPNDYSMIDHVLVSSNIVVKNAFIYNEYSEYCGKYESDHYPVVVDIYV